MKSTKRERTAPFACGAGDDVRVPVGAAPEKAAQESKAGVRPQCGGNRAPRKARIEVHIDGHLRARTCYIQARSSENGAKKNRRKKFKKVGNRC